MEEDINAARLATLEAYIAADGRGTGLGRDRQIESIIIDYLTKPHMLDSRTRTVAFAKWAVDHMRSRV